MKIKQISIISAAAAVLIAALTLFTLAANNKPKNQTLISASQASYCSIPQVAADLQYTSSPNVQVMQKDFSAPAGEPQIYARVNGTPIYGYTIEFLAEAAYHNHQLALQSMDAAALQALPAAALQQLKEPLAQLRADMLQQQIDNQLLLQDAQKLKIFPAQSVVSGVITRDVSLYNSSPHNSPAWYQFTAILCADGLTAQNYASNPQVVATVTQAITLQMMRYKAYADLPIAMQHNTAMVDAKIQTFIQNLAKSANIVVYYK